jgi:hypothetical protein
MASIRSFSVVSPRLIRHIKRVYEFALEDTKQHGVAGYTEYALPMYILAVATVEAFVNESFLSYPALLYFNSSLDELRDRLDKEEREKLKQQSVDWMPLKDKLICIPRILLGQTFSRGEQPYQDMEVAMCAEMNKTINVSG